MDKELTYLNDEGNTVFTSFFLKNRKFCCKTACLHCPYGFTVKKHGIQFLDVIDNDRTKVDAILEENSLTLDYSTFFPDNIKFIKIKDVICGVNLKNHLVVKQMILLPHFQNQGISKELVESYYFS